MPTVLFCSQTAHTGGGVEVWLQTLVRGLPRHGWTVVLGLARGARFHDPERFARMYGYPAWEEIDGRSGFAETRHRALHRLFDRVRPDVIVPVQLADALYAAVAGKRRGLGARLVGCLHSQPGVAGRDLLACRDDLDAAVANSRRGADWLRREGSFPAGVVEHIPTGVPPAARASQRPGDHLALAYVGRLDQPEKRVRDLVMLMRALKDVALTLHLVGDGPERAFLEERLGADIAAGRVVFHGLLTREALYEAIYPRVHGLMILSEAEGGPIVAWEAMVNGVVPITSQFVGLPEEGVLRNGENALTFPVGDMTAAACAVRELGDRPRFEALSAAARRLDASRTETGFVEAWNRLLRRIRAREARIGTGVWPARRSPGRLAGVLPNARLLALARGLLRRRHEHGDPGGEWPHV